ncbi:hypothetical protein MD588_24635 [Photobacterium sp. SDRW27]|uniref:hypothetical protein n=1 Tax=Photobacterium obscurum TaxID=2829490 RepID=UPI002244069E|nr:hypothetical protein [Photobacterium obscurum]MCW8331984.1 hypothetical protein [Photobacterium obscurum]
MKGTTLRKLLRAIHFISAALVGSYIYSPWSSNLLFETIIMWGAVPILTLSGLAMWKQGVLMNWIRWKPKTIESS